MTGSRRGQHWLPWLAMGLALLATAWVYSPGLAGPWFFDDYPNLLPLLNNREQGWLVLMDQFLFSSSGATGRPVSMLSFIFSAMTSADSLPGWKAFNLVLHLLTGLTLAWLALRLLQDLAGWESRAAALGAVLVAALWLLHPLHVSTVLYTVQRMTILPALFCGLGLALYLSGRRALGQEGRSGWGRMLGALLLCWPLATLSKENGVLLGLYIVLIEGLLAPLPDARQQQRIRLLLGVVVVLPALAVAAYLMLYPEWLFGGYRLRDFTPVERLLTEARVVWGYVFWVFAPVQSQLGFMHDDIALSYSLFEPPGTLLAVMAWLLLLPCMWMLRRKAPLVIAGLGLFLISQLLESTVIALEIAYEHRTYFGSFGLILAGVALLAVPLNNLPLRRVLAGLVLSVLLVLCVLRVQSWSNIDALYTAMWRAHPASPRLVTTFAAQFARNGDYAAALAALEQTDEPRVAAARLYVLCLRDKALADRELDTLHPIAPRRLTDYMLSALVAVSRLGLDGNCRFDDLRFIALLDRVVTPTNVSGLERYKLLIYRAHHQNRVGLHEAALSSLSAAQALQPASLIPLSLRCEWLLAMGRRAEAVDAYARLREKVAISQSDFSARMAELEAMLAQGLR